MHTVIWLARWILKWLRVIGQAQSRTPLSFSARLDMFCTIIALVDNLYFNCQWLSY